MNIIIYIAFFYGLISLCVAYFYYYRCLFADNEDAHASRCNVAVPLSTLAAILELFSRMQGMCAEARATLAHVEFEVPLRQDLPLLVSG